MKTSEWGAMLMDEVLKEIRQFMETKANPEMAAKYTRYFREGYEPFGITQADLEVFKKSMLQRYQPIWGINEFFDLGDQLFATGRYEEGGLAILLIAGLKTQFNRETINRIGNWLQNGVKNWAHSDVICSELITPLWKKELVTLTDISSWRESDSKWQRRAAAVCLLPMVKKADDIAPYLEFVRPLMTDSVREVQQGTGWMLREAWKRHPSAAETFLLEYKDISPRLIIQYATEKMSKEEKARYKANKKP
ncbi:MAG: DNA alkylation repair protein [Methylocystaceae bacterium]